jgi:hypothetical protein
VGRPRRREGPTRQRSRCAVIVGRHHPDGQHHRRRQQQAAHQTVGHRQHQHGDLLARNPDGREARQVGADSEHELDREQPQQHARERRGDAVTAASQARGHHRDERKDGHRAGEMKPQPPGVGQQRTQHDLRVQRHHRHEREPTQRWVDDDRGTRCGGCGEERERRHQREERLGQWSVHHGEGVGEQDDAKAADHALRDDDRERDQSQHPQPAAARPQGGGQGDREQADEGTEQTVRVLVEDAAHHAGPREEEHVVAEGARPVRDGEGRPCVRDQAAEHDEHDGRGRRRDCQAMSQHAAPPGAPQCRRRVPAPWRGGCVCGRKSSLASGSLYS